MSIMEAGSHVTVYCRRRVKILVPLCVTCLFAVVTGLERPIGRGHRLSELGPHLAPGHGDEVRLDHDGRAGYLRQVPEASRPDVAGSIALSLRLPLPLHVADGQPGELAARRHGHLAGLPLGPHAVECAYPDDPAVERHRV